MTRNKFALYTIGAFGVYVIFVLALGVIFPALKWGQPDSMFQIYAAFFTYWTRLELGELFFLMIYILLGMLSADLPVLLFIAAFYAILIFWGWAEMQRLRYLHHSGWWVLLGVIPYVGALLYLYLLFWPAPVLPAGREAVTCPD